MGDTPRVEFIDEWELRRMFNDRDYWEQVRAGRMKTRLMENGHPSPPLANEPYCTRSQTVAYLDDDENVVVYVHQYLRPDGTIGLSGRPDPKELYEDDTWYVLDAND